MSAFQKQLATKRASRVNLKQKKLLAMMEDETVIDDPKTKLIGYRKLEVGTCREFAKGCVCKIEYLHWEAKVQCNE